MSRLPTWTSPIAPPAPALLHRHPDLLLGHPIDDVVHNVGLLLAGRQAQQTTLAQISSLVGAVVPAWQTRTEVKNGDDMGLVRPPAEPGLTADIIHYSNCAASGRRTSCRLTRHQGRPLHADPPSAFKSITKADGVHRLIPAIDRHSHWPIGALAKCIRARRSRAAADTPGPRLLISASGRGEQQNQHDVQGHADHHAMRVGRPVPRSRIGRSLLARHQPGHDQRGEAAFHPAPTG